jgi:hypothetical protein
MILGDLKMGWIAPKFKTPFPCGVSGDFSPWIWERQTWEVEPGLTTSTKIVTHLKLA